MVRKMSWLIRGSPEARRVTSRKPEVAIGARSLQAGLEWRRVNREVDRSRGRWLTAAAYWSCSSASRKRGSAPTSRTRPTTARTALS